MITKQEWQRAYALCKLDGRVNFRRALAYTMGQADDPAVERLELTGRFSDDTTSETAMVSRHTDSGRVALASADEDADDDSPEDVWTMIGAETGKGLR